MDSAPSGPPPRSLAGCDYKITLLTEASSGRSKIGPLGRGVDRAKPDPGLRRDCHQTTDCACCDHICPSNRCGTRLHHQCFTSSMIDKILPMCFSAARHRFRVTRLIYLSAILGTHAAGCLRFHNFVRARPGAATFPGYASQI